MSDIKKENDDLALRQAAPAPAPTSELASAEGKPAASTPAEGVFKPETSKGEKIYNWTVYSGINYWVNLISSVIVADKVTNGSWRKPLDWTIGKTAKGISKMGISLEKAHHQTRVGLETMTLLTGGWLLLVPMKIMEDNKRPIVHWINKHLGKPQCAPDGREQTSDEIYIEKEQPKQTWGNVIKRRIYATLAVMGTGLALDYTFADRSQRRTHSHKIDPYDPKSEVITHETYLGGKERTTNFVVGGIRTGMKKVGLEKQADSKKLKDYLDLAVLDTVFTKITAVIMYVTNGAKKEKMPHEMGEDTPISRAKHEPISISMASDQESKLSDKIGKRERPQVTASGSYTDMVSKQQNESNLSLAP